MKITTELGVAEIREGDADAATAEFYGAIRDAFGTPWLNLVWRALAAIPGALPYAWQFAIDGIGWTRLLDAASELRARLPLPTVEPLPECVLRAAGLDPADETHIARIIEVYNRTNAINLVLDRTLLLALRNGDGNVASVPRMPERPPLQAVADLPLPVPIKSMSRELRDIVQCLNALGQDTEPEILATIWRNLAHWPCFLALSYAWLAEFQRAKELPRLRGVLRAEADDIAKLLLAARAANLPAPPPAPSSAALQGLLQRFSEDVFLRMIPTSETLRLILR